MRVRRVRRGSRALLMARLAVLVLLAACWHDAPESPRPATPHVRPPPVVLEVAISSRRFPMAARADVLVGLRLTNHTRAMIDPQISDVELELDGEANIDFRAAVSNGAVDPFETALPAG